MTTHRHILLVSILLATSLVVAYLYSNKANEDIIGTIEKIATIKNESGFSFSVYRHPSQDNVWVEFSLPENSSEKLDKDHPPIIQIGEGVPRHMETSKEFQESINAVGSDLVVYEWRPKQVAAVVWHGSVKEGLSQDIINLMQEDKIMVRYFLSSGAVNETSFSLKGMANSIAYAIDISPIIDYVAQQKAEEYRQAYGVAADKCKIGTKEFDSCFTRVNTCRIKSERDIDKFNACTRN